MTEDSIVPFMTDIKEEKVIRIPDKFSTSNFIPVADQPLVVIDFQKSSKKITFERSYNTLDMYMSYVGGLIGTIIGLMFILTKYNEKAYEISLSRKLMHDNENKSIDSGSFNIGYFILMPIKSLLSACSIGFNWKSTQTYLEAC